MPVRRPIFYGFVAAFVLITMPGCSSGNAEPETDAKTGETKIRVEIISGHETVPVDHGRPVTLIGPALGVTPEIFREAFSGVSPAPAGSAPDRERVHSNKDALLRVLGPHGITNEELDRVSDYYRYNPGRGEMWPTREAEIYAVVKDGVVERFEIADSGAGYSSVPSINVPDTDQVNATVKLSFGKEIESNGSITAVELVQ